MKINWGTSIVIAIALFMAFILYFVMKVQLNSKYDNELVVEEYYKHDAHFGDEMAKAQNAQDLADKPTITASPKGIEIVFPKTMSQKITGNVSLYRPSDKKLDFEVLLSTSNPSLLIPKSDLAGGRWDITMEWKYQGKDYLERKHLNLE
ncbi:MAG TPA: FixH family protein [Flavobacterium sp.]|nr:FixH family protein [Flavobacterium sp.]